MVKAVGLRHGLVGALVSIIVVLSAGCLTKQAHPIPQTTVPQEDRWGIYSLNLDMGEVELLYSNPETITVLRLNSSGDRFVFSQVVRVGDTTQEEIFTLSIDGQDLQRLTNNEFRDLYPAWSPDDARVAFLTFRGPDLDIYIMDADGGNVKQLFDSGSHDADIHWVGEKIAFTANNRIWIMNDDGTGAHQITEPPRAGEWGNANLPFGDYDPRFNSDGSKIVFERLVGDQSIHGNYDLYLMDIDGSDVTRLTDTGYSQGLASWSHSGSRIVYTVAAIDEVGQYNIYIMNADGTDNRDITPDTFPTRFLCNSPIFSLDDTRIYFIGEWWSDD